MRYAQASQGQVGYSSESTAYTKDVSSLAYFGIVDEDVEPPMPNPYTPMATGGERRGPHVLSPDAREYTFDVPFHVLDHEAPFEYALGQRATTSQTGYNEHLITEADKLPTFTLEHQQEDLNLQSWYIGCKMGLQLQASQGETLSATASITSGIHDYDDTVTTGYTDLATPSGKSPFKFWMKGDVQLSNADRSFSDTIKSLATVSGMDLSWDPGLEVQHHGDGRDGYSVVETTSADLYDMSLDVTVIDTDLFARAADDEVEVDVEIPFYRDPSVSSPNPDAVFVRLFDCKITEAPIPNPSSGALEQTVGLQPRETEIEIREPTA